MQACKARVSRSMTEGLVDAFQSLVLDKMTLIPRIYLSNRPEEDFACFLNPKTLRESALCAGDTVQLEQNGFVWFVQIWPSLSVNVNDIRLSQEMATVSGLDVSALIRCSKLSRPPTPVRTVDIECLSEEEFRAAKKLLSMVKHFALGQKYQRGRISPAFSLTGPLGTVVDYSSVSHFSRHHPVNDYMPSNLFGLDSLKTTIKKIVTFTLKRSGTLSKLDARPSQGALVWGPPGTGKTLLIKTIAKELGLNIFTVDGAEMSGKYYGERETAIRHVVLGAIDARPSLIFIDELEALCPNRTNNASSQDNRLVSVIISLLDEIQSKSFPVFIFGATNAPGLVDAALRRPGRFDYDFEVQIPTKSLRLEILNGFLSNLVHDLNEEMIISIAEKTPGYVGADLSLLLKEALILANSGIRDRPSLTYQSLIGALSIVRPSCTREKATAATRIDWSEIAGYDDIKSRLKESIEMPLQFPEKFTSLGLSPPKGILLFGPPGCSKTMLAKAISAQSNLSFISLKGPEIFSKWVGDSEKAIQEVFRKARAASPAVLFIDEIDAIAPSRGGSSSVSDRVLSQLLSELDGLDPLLGVTIVAATNRPDVLDPAILRPGRFDRRIYVPLPNPLTRRKMLEIHSSRIPFGNDVNMDDIVSKTEGFTGAELAYLIKEAAFSSALRGSSTVEAVDFNLILQAHKPRISLQEIEYFKSLSLDG